MLTDVRKCAPLEACGLVAGRNRHSQAVYPIVNIKYSPFSFLMDPQEQLRVLHKLDAQNWDLLAIYHSHPQGPNHPSATDLQEAAYPDAVNLIWSRPADEWICRGFIIDDSKYREIQVHITPIA